MKKIIQTLVCILLLTIFNNKSFSQINWFLQNSGTFENLNDIKFLNENTGWAVGNAGVLLKTTNGGTNWNIVNTSFAETNFRIAVTSPNVIYISCSNSKILKSMNGGVSWSLITINESFLFNIKSIYFRNSNTGFAAWSDPVFPVIRTTNGGTNWFNLFGSSGQYIPEDIFFIEGTSFGFCAGQGYSTSTTNFAYTTNETSWNRVQVGHVGLILRSVHFITSTNGFVCGDNGNLFKSANGGANWDQHLSNTVNNLNSIHALDLNKVHCAGNNGTYLYTSNGGSNWNSYNLGYTNNFNRIYFHNNSIGWITGNKGLILKTTTGGVNIVKSAAEISDRYILHQNFPNPFNPETKIKFEIPKDTYLIFKVIDIAGKEVFREQKPNLTSGIYELTFNGNNLSGGIYFYSIETKLGTLTNKMMLVK